MFESVQAKEQEYYKSEIEKLDQAQAKKIAEEEQRRSEAEKKARDQQGQLVATLVTQTGLTVDKARELLISKGWNFAQALAELKEQERRETSVLRFLQDFPDVDFD